MARRKTSVQFHRIRLARLRLITQRRRNPPTFIKQPINEPSSIDQNIIENGKGSRISVRTATPGTTAAGGNEREEQNSNKIVHSARAGKVKSQTPKVEKQGAYHCKFLMVLNMCAEVLTDFR